MTNKKPPPEYGVAIETLGDQALEALKARIWAAMSNSSRCVQMDIEKTDPASMVCLATKLVDADEPLFVTQSKNAADLLATAQTSRAFPGGILVVFTGLAGVPARRIVGVIKAEVHSGFTRDQTDGRLTLKFLDKLLLTPQTKLYKIGLFIEDKPTEQSIVERWIAYIYDETMTVQNRYGAAQYFYGSFLGLVFPESSARQTKQFHDLTKQFIQAMDVPEEDKIVFHNALVTYLRADQSPTVEVGAFSGTYFGDAAFRDSYQDFMTRKGFPNNAVNKDISDVSKSLHTRRLNFRNKVSISAPADGFADLLTIDPIAGTPSANGQVPEWTRVTIKARIANQE